MTDTANTRKLDETSPSIQVHLEIVQSVIQRMAENSVSCKTWCITIVSAILVIVADKGNSSHLWIALFPTVLFAILDAYYLALEKGFRNSYNLFVRRLHEGVLTQDDLYLIVSSGVDLKLQMQALKSFAVWGFYIPVIVLIMIVRSVVIS